MSGVEPLDLTADRQDGKTVDRRNDKRVFVSLPGRYSLGDNRNSRGESRLFACRAVNISTHAIAVAAPVKGKAGIRVMADIEQLGRVKGSIIRVFELGFELDVEVSDHERNLLAARIDWIERHKDFEILDNRTHARFIPRRPLSLLSLTDGTVMPCFVVDISVSGAAVSADIVPEIGTVLAVGRVDGRVVRSIPGGFAVQFITMQDRREVESLVIPR